MERARCIKIGSKSRISPWYTKKDSKEIYNDENKSMTFNVRLKLAECVVAVADLCFFSCLASWEREITDTHTHAEINALEQKR